jgi:SAM-dependent methyltransferase
MGFWQQLGGKHRADLAEYGFQSIKRNLAFRYFTWRWSWSSIRRSEQMRFLLRHSSPLSIVRCALAAADLSDDTWSGMRWPSSGKGSSADATEPLDSGTEEDLGKMWPKRDRWLYVFAVRLLWRYATRHDPTRTTALPEPLTGNPLPVMSSGRLISQDLANSALELAAIERVLDGRRPASILELGAGYGRTAYALMSRYPQATYTIVDIEPALSISRWYLSLLFDPSRLRFLHPEDAGQIASDSIDLALSISSLQEMTPDLVAGYLALFDRASGGGVVYLKQWLSWFNPVDKVRMTFDEYAIPD